MHCTSCRICAGCPCPWECALEGPLCLSESVSTVSQSEQINAIANLLSQLIQRNRAELRAGKSFESNDKAGRGLVRSLLWAGWMSMVLIGGCTTPPPTQSQPIEPLPTEPVEFDEQVML